METKSILWYVKLLLLNREARFSFQQKKKKKPNKNNSIRVMERKRSNNLFLLSFLFRFSSFFAFTSFFIRWRFAEGHLLENEARKQEREMKKHRRWENQMSPRGKKWKAKQTRRASQLDKKPRKTKKAYIIHSKIEISFCNSVQLGNDSIKVPRI